MEPEKPKGKDRGADNTKTIADLSASLKKLAAFQEEQLVIDLDAAWDEHKKVSEPIVFKFQGKMFEVPASMPADFGRFYRRHCLKSGKDPQTGESIVNFVIPEGEMLFEFMEGLAGVEFAKAWSETKIPMQVLAGSVIGPIMRKWGLVAPVDAPKGDEEKKNQTPES